MDLYEFLVWEAKERDRERRKMKAVEKNNKGHFKVKEKRIIRGKKPDHFLEVKELVK